MTLKVQCEICLKTGIISDELVNGEFNNVPLEELEGFAKFRDDDGKIKWLCISCDENPLPRKGGQ